MSVSQDHPRKKNTPRMVCAAKINEIYCGFDTVVPVKLYINSPFLHIILLAMMASQVQASSSLIISEVASWSNDHSPVFDDWFELTNISGASINISGWKMDDNSNAFGSSVLLNGVTTIAAGESVIFIENGSLLKNTVFKSTWFGASSPAGLQFGSYAGAKVGLSAGNGDAVNIFNASGTLQASVTFGPSDSVNPLQSFDNAGGLDNTVISLLSLPGINGAFVAATDTNEIGSPGRIANVNAVPLPAAVWFFGTAIFGVARFSQRRMERVL